MKSPIAYLLMQMPAPSEEFLSIEINGLRRAGIDVEVFCLRGRHPQFEKLRADQKLSKVPIHNFPYLFDWGLWADVGYWLRKRPTVLWHLVLLITGMCWRRPELWLKSLVLVPKSLSIARRVEQKNVQLVHAAWSHYPAITAYLIKKLLPFVQVTQSLGAYDRTTRHPMTRVAAEHAVCIFTQSSATAALIRNEWPRTSTPVRIILRGVDLEEARPLRKANQRIPGLIVSAGRLIKVKGHQYVIEAFAKVRPLIPHARLLILGEGRYRQELEEIVARLNLTGLVELPGHLKQSDYLNLISQASVFVFATESEDDVLPNVVKEAMGVGVPVITTPTTGIEELIHDGRTGYLVPMRDVDALSDRIFRILSGERSTEQLVERAIQHVETYFDLRKTTEERKRLYKQIAMSKTSISYGEDISLEQIQEIPGARLPKRTLRNQHTKKAS